MTAMQINAMNTELWQNINAIADNEPLMKRLAKYAAKLVKEKEDPTLMTKEEFFAKLKRGEEAYRSGKCTRLLPNESVTEMLKRNGYAV